MANFFDQFDDAPAVTAPPAASNFFDQFDEAPASRQQAAPTAKQGEAGPNDWLLKYRVPGVPGLSDIAKSVYNSVVSGVTLPRDVYEGKVDLQSEEAAGRALDLAGIASPLSAGRPAARGGITAAAPGPSPEQYRAATALMESRARIGETVSADDALQQVMRGAERPTSADVATAAESVGVSLPRIALAPPAMQRAGAALADVPFVGAPLQKGAEQALTRAQERVGDIAQGMGAVSREGAGTGLQEGIEAFKRTGLPQIESEAFAPIRSAIPDTAGFLPQHTNAALVEIGRRLDNSAGKLTGEAARVAQLAERGNLGFQAMQDARSALGRQMRDPMAREGYDDHVGAALYGALSKDLEAAAQQTGGDALAAQWRAANETVSQAQQQFASVKSLASAATSPNSAFETAFAMAMDRRGDAGRLYKLKQTVGPEAWEGVGATALDRMGRDASEAFSAAQFVSAYDRMAPSGRRVLFGASAKAVDDLATSLRALQGVEKMAAPPARAQKLGGYVGIGAGLSFEPVSTAVGGTLGYLTAQGLARPATVAQLARLARAHEVLIRRPSAGLARQAEMQRNRLGVLLTDDGASYATANDLLSPFADAARSTYPGSQDESQRRYNLRGGPTR